MTPVCHTNTLTHAADAHSVSVVLLLSPGYLSNGNDVTICDESYFFCASQICSTVLECVWVGAKMGGLVLVRG